MQTQNIKQNIKQNLKPRLKPTTKLIGADQQAVVLITGFAPFDKDPINSSWDVAQAFSSVEIPGAKLVVRQLPSEFNRSIEVLESHLKKFKPGLIISLGQANTRNEISVERVAININDARIADNAGAKPIDTQVVSKAPVGYFSSLPIKAIVKAMRQAGIPASVSQTAGTYVCNHLFFGLMHLLATQSSGARGGFLHLPPLPSQAARLPGLSSLALQTMVDAVHIAIVTSLKRTKDIRLSAGKID